MNWRQVRKWATIGTVIGVLGITILATGLFGRDAAAFFGTVFAVVGFGIATFAKHTRPSD